MKPIIKMMSNPSNVGSVINFSSSTAHHRGGKKCETWPWGTNNMMPSELANIARQSTIHHRILNDKSDYIAGNGFNCSSDQPQLQSFINHCNHRGQSLRWVVSRLAVDKCTFGNAFMEVVTDESRTHLNFYHHDASKCRLSKEEESVVLHHDWTRFKQSESSCIPLYPNFAKQKDGSYRSFIHYKDYEPMFTHYGVPKYIAALNAIDITNKTDQWNITRLANAFQPSGVMVLDGSVDSPDEAAEIANVAEQKFSGKPGQVMFMVKNGIEGDSTKFVPINNNTDGDWQSLHQQSAGDIIVAHSWFRTLSGIDYSSGFSAERVKYEYTLALGSIIKVEQQELLEPIVNLLQDICKIDSSSLEFINTPPFKESEPYMYVWELRQKDGLSYNPDDPTEQQLFKNL